MGYGSSGRGGATVLWVCLHTGEGARTARNMASFLNNNPNASSHGTCDASEILYMVPRSRAAWTLGPGNPNSVNLEMCAFARWSRAQWLSTGTVDGCPNPRRIVSQAAIWARRECDHWGIPYHRIGPGAVSGWRESIIHHNDYTQGSGWGSHWDCGTGFPWDVLLAEVAGKPAPKGGVTTPTWSLPSGHFYGDIKGGARSHGGFYPAERPMVRMIQQRLQALGYAPKYSAWADGVYGTPTVEAVRKWQKSTGRDETGKVYEGDWHALFPKKKRSKAKAAVKKVAAKVKPRGAPRWPLRRDEYFGLITGPAASHGGYYRKERKHIKRIQRALISQGYVPGVRNPLSGWADGIFERPTAEAVERFQRVEMPNTTRYGEVWWDDWAQLLG